MDIPSGSVYLLAVLNCGDLQSLVLPTSAFETDEAALSLAQDVQDSLNANTLHPFPIEIEVTRYDVSQVNLPLP